MSPGKKMAIFFSLYMQLFFSLKKEEGKKRRVEQERAHTYMANIIIYDFN